MLRILLTGVLVSLACCGLRSLDRPSLEMMNGWKPVITQTCPVLSDKWISRR